MVPPWIRPRKLDQKDHARYELIVGYSLRLSILGRKTWDKLGWISGSLEKPRAFRTQKDFWLSGEPSEVRSLEEFKS